MCCSTGLTAASSRDGETMNQWTFVTVIVLGSALIVSGTPEGPPAAPSPIIPVQTVTAPAATDDLFKTADRCIACHKGITASDGTDVSIGYDWRASMMANSARDPYWHAAVRREITDFPESSVSIETNCSRCHMPMANVVAASQGRETSVFGNLPIQAGAEGEAALAADGVSCAACHQIAPDGLGSEASFTGQFTVNTDAAPDGRTVYGPFEPDEGGAGIMHSATGFRPTEGAHMQSAELCSSCHTLMTHSIRNDGSDGVEFPEQAPYLEWQASSFGRKNVTCQDCHMPEVGEDVPVTAVLGRERPNVSRHVFRGGNFFMLRMLNRYRDELGVTALPQEMALAAARTEDHLREATATVEVMDVSLTDGVLSATVEIRNMAGHKFPTAYPSRRAWLHVTVTDRGGDTVFESGAFSPDGRVIGDDHDANGTTYEPHYAEITSPDQVQIYQSVMVDQAGEVTTGLMSAERWAKDNRLLPDGFDASAADPRVRPVGEAATDLDFVAGLDRVQYSVPTGDAAGPLTVTAELWFQPIGYRWAQNLGEYDTFETQRFFRYYRDMAERSAIVIAEASEEIR